MKALRLVAAVWVIAAASTILEAQSVEMANFAPADAKGLIETVNAAELRQMLLDSKFWAALQQTQAFRDWRASDKYSEMRERIDRFLADLRMTQDQAIQTYLGGRTALVLFAGEDPKKPDGVILTEATNEMSQRLVEAAGGQVVGRYRDVALWEVRKDNRVDRMAFAGGLLLVSGSKGNELERVLDVVAGGGTSLGADGRFNKAVEGLPPGWRARAYCVESLPRKSPGAVAVYPQGGDRLHIEWRVVSAEADLALTRPAVLTAPNILPADTVAAAATVFYPEAIWNAAKVKIGANADGQEKLSKAEMFIRGWFPGHTIESIVSAFGPEAAMGLVKGSGNGAPGLVGLVRITPTGGPVARAFKDGLAAKAMILGALAPRKEGESPKLTVREEAHGAAQILIVEAPEFLQKALGDWANYVGLTVAVTNDWLIVGTTPASVKTTLDTASGGESLAAALAKSGEKVPAAPVTRWGVIEPASGADITLALAEKLAGKERIDQARKMTNLAELMKLVRRITWERTDEPTVVRGRADIRSTN